MKRRVVVLGMGGALSLACSVSPVPEPPEGEPQLHDAIALETCTDDCSRVVLRGQPGATENASHVWAVHLDAPDVPLEVPTDPDGGFVLALDRSGEVRVLARRGARRSAPRDFDIDPSRFAAPFRPAPRPFADCFAAPLEWELGETALGSSVTRSLALQSDCSTDLALSAIELRAARTELRVEAPATPLTVQRGGSLNVTVTFTPSGPGRVEEILLVEIAGPQRDRRAITLFGDSPP
jgi:hypothetical protein